MNPGGPVEEVGQTARGLIDALKAQPAVLALSLAQIAMLVFLFYALSAAAGFRDQMLKQQFEFAHKVTELLDRKSTRLNSSHSGESRMPSSA